MTQSLNTDDGRSALRMTRRLAHPPERVWAAMVEPDRLAAWFPGSPRPELRLGGVVEFDFGGSGTVTELEPGRVIAYTWDTDHLRWEVRPDPDAEGAGTLLELVHTFDDRPGAASFAAGWHTCIAHLDLALAGRPEDDPGVDHVALHEQLVGELGLDDCAVTRLPDGWQVRLERQLVRPADAVAVDLGAAWPDAETVRDDRPTLLEQRVDDGLVRWELGEGTGHGARLTVTWTGPDPVTRDAAAVRIPAVARQLSYP